MSSTPAPALIALKDEIESIVAPYHRDERNPHFSKATMVVMAIVCSECDNMRLARKKDIYRWIVETFKCYRKKAINQFATRATSKSNPKPRSVVEIDEVVFDLYDLPLAGPADHVGPADRFTNHYSVPASAGRIFLKHVLTPPRNGNFRFLELPAELRIRIYEMVFSFPDIAIGVDPNSDVEVDNYICLWKREHDAEPGKIEEQTPLLEARPIDDILTLLSVKKQIYQESAPYFYRINHFQVNSMRNLAVWVENIAPNRLEHVRHLSFEYRPTPTKWLAKMKHTFKILALHKAVKTIEIETDDDEWFSRTVTVKSKTAGVPNRTKLRYDGSGSLAHIRELAKLVGIVDKLSFRGECPRIEEYLRAQMTEEK